VPTPIVIFGNVKRNPRWRWSNLCDLTSAVRWRLEARLLAIRAERLGDHQNGGGGRLLRILALRCSKAVLERFWIAERVRNNLASRLRDRNVTADLACFPEIRGESIEFHGGVNECFAECFHGQSVILGGDQGGDHMVELLHFELHRFGLRRRRRSMKTVSHGW